MSKEIEELNELFTQHQARIREAVAIEKEMEVILNNIKTQNENFSYVCYQFAQDAERVIKFAGMVDDMITGLLRVSDNIPELTESQKKTLDDIKSLQVESWKAETAKALKESQETILNIG